MTDIIFSFDTEDFTSSRAADGIVEMAEILRSEGIRGCFCLVGLLAEQLLAWGRADVLEALRHHEIDFHSFGHSLHPCLNEYTNVEDFRAAYNEVVRQESAGMAAVRAVTGASRLYAAVPPGPNENYVAMYAYTDMGIPIYAGELLDSPGGRNVFFCNALYMRYFDCFESIVQKDRAGDPAYLDRLAARETAVIYNHPNRALYHNFWDGVNYKGGNRHPFGQWEEAKRMTDEERAHFRETVRSFIRALKADGRFRFRTYSEVAAEQCGQARFVRREDMPGLLTRLKENFRPQEAPVSLCISDIFAAAASFLRGNAMFAAGRVYGFLDTPHAISETVTVRASAVREAAQKVDLRTFLPPLFEVDGVTLGPADFLFAMLETLCGGECITLTPREQNIDLTPYHPLEAFRLDGWVFPADFHPDILQKRTPLQGWTIRPSVHA